MAFRLGSGASQGENWTETKRDSGETETVVQQRLDTDPPPGRFGGKEVTDDPSSAARGRRSPLVLTVNVNLMLVILTGLSVITHFWRLEQPRAVVFDETHFGLFTSYYMKGMFFFDVHPPLGKLLLALMGYLAGFSGDFSFEKIGQEYPCALPVWHLRSLPALCGALLTPLSFMVLEGMGFSQWTAALGALLVLTDNSLLTQSRFILLDSMLLCAMLLTFLALIKFRQQQDRPFSLQWWVWLTQVGVFLACVVSIKYSGLFTALVIVGIIFVDYWMLVGDGSVTNSQLFKHTCARALLLIGIPIVLYTSLFYVHLSILYRSGPHDNVMTSAFQSSLQGGLSKVTHGQPTEIAYGSQITLRHTHNTGCWLHSHNHTYPLRYSEVRGSSLQQQVTCYTFKDVNNWWVVKEPGKDDIRVESPPRPVKHGDIIQIVHGTTGRLLNSHDVGAPQSPHLMEVSCYIDYNISFPAQDLWRLEIVNHDVEGDVWKAIHSQIRLVHVNTSQAMKITGQQLPEWGFYQFEVATDKVLAQESTIWNVEENKYSLEKQVEYWDHTKEMGFFSKFWELQWKMLQANKRVVDDHKYRSEPSEWPLMERGIAYWMSDTSNAQIHLLGNAIIWWSADVAIVVYLVITVIYILRHQRACDDLSKAEWTRLYLTGALFVGWVVNYVPYFMMERTLFLHHYFPALLWKILLLAATVELVHQHVLKTPSQRSLFSSLLVSWLTSVLIVFWNFLPLCLGTPALSEEEIESLRWMEGWGVLIHGKKVQ